MPQGGTLRIEARCRTRTAAKADVEPGEYVAVSVIDTGIGMDADTLAQVFDPFFTTKEVGKGTGLGLSMVYGFAKQSGGGVEVASEAGKGTRVSLLLPRAKAAAEQLSSIDHRSAELGKGDEAILVVEDDDDVRAYIVEVLRELNYRVIEAHDGPSALRLLERQERPIALLVTDVVMPQMSGSELAKAARLVHPDLKVLYTSGYTRDAISHDGRLDPGVELLSKPFTYRTLASKIRDVLDDPVS